MDRRNHSHKNQSPIDLNNLIPQEPEPLAEALLVPIDKNTEILQEPNDNITYQIEDFVEGRCIFKLLYYLN